MKFILPGFALGLTFLVAACGGLAFTAANAPALSGDFERRATVACGTHERQSLDIHRPKDRGHQGNAGDARPIVMF
jgi:hypothetical protein